MISQLIYETLDDVCESQHAASEATFNLCVDAQDYKIHYRLFFTALLTAYKYIRERSVSNLAWSRASDCFFELDEVNIMQRMFLNALGYDLVVEDRNTQQEWLLMVQEMTLAASPTTSASSGWRDMTPEASVEESLDKADSTDSMSSESTDRKKSKKGWGSFWSLFKKKALA
ncbi:UNVERIFIED_CONTAM: hypothetical protein HDU68_011241 [Siphonaria sp. JEL0065]|nr:hypothetical protein HDU68_011241 [Siphonaria sp. JEL0065]